MERRLIIKLKNITKVYRSGLVETSALNNISFDVGEGEFIAIMGPSGSGKSTLMNILGALDLPSSGEYLLEDEAVEKLSDDKLAEIRNRKIGFIFQSFNLLPRTSALNNVMLPMRYSGLVREESERRAQKFLEMVGLKDRMFYLTNQLSGGQQQRVAIARSLTMNPIIILADEPTGNLATTQAEEIMEIFQRLNDEGRTIIMITHERDIAECAQRVIHLRDGSIVSDDVYHDKRRIASRL